MLASDCGLSANNGMGLSEVSWSEIQAFMDVMGVKSYWIAQALKSISRAFVSAYHEYNDKPLGVSPYDDGLDKETAQAALSKQLDDFIKNF
jgi:hypothetical protein